jgi:hypothetical protein
MSSPKKVPNRYAPRTVRFTDADWKRIDARATKDNLVTAAWVRKVVLDHIDK